MLKDIQPIKLTKKQADEFNFAKNTISTSQLPIIIHDGNDEEWSYLDEVSGVIFGHQQGEMTNKNIEDIMKLWLFPELLEIIDK